MIIFQTLKHEIDFSNLPITFTEANNMFSAKQSKSYSFPFEVYLTGDLFEKLGIVTVNNLVQYQSKIYGVLILDDVFYDGYIAINEVEGDKAELTLFYGKETLQVFDKKLSALPFPVIYAEGGVNEFAKGLINKAWPEVTHNFPKVYRPEIQKEQDFDKFNLFLNNYGTNGQVFDFLSNSKEVIDNEEVVFNRNIMAPFPYLMEVLRVGFKSEGYNISGTFVNDPIRQKMLLVPKNYFEQYSATEYFDYSFSNFTSQDTINGNVVNVYRQIHQPQQIGSYSLDIRLNLSNALAKYFNLKVMHGDVELYNVFSENKEVILEHTLDINITDNTVFEQLTVELKLNHQEASIELYNSFKYQFKEGRLNVFPTLYNLSDFMPDIIFREFTNRLKTTYNLKFDYSEKTVNINYIDKALPDYQYEDHSHLEQVNPKRILSKNNLFKLKLPDSQEVWVDKNGQTFTDSDYASAEIEEIKIELLPLKVKDNYGYITAVYPKDEEDLMLVLYDGLQNQYNHTVDSVDNVTLSLQDTYNTCWKQWLKFRANSETIPDKFILSVFEKIDIEKGSFKYNKNNIIKSIERTRINETEWEVNTESETF